MTPYWVVFRDRSDGTIEADSWSDAGLKAAAFGTVVEIKQLPYPAEPRLGEKTTCPSFCISPLTCSGRSSCPRSYACSE